MKIKQLLIEEDNSDLSPAAAQWLNSVGITNYDVIGPNMIDVNQDINWGSITPPSQAVAINHVSGNFSWTTTDGALLAKYNANLAQFFPRTVSGDCTIKCDNTGSVDTVKTSTLPKGTGRGKLTIICPNVFDMMLSIDNQFTATYSSYDIQTAMVVNPSHNAGSLPSPWNSPLTIVVEDASPLQLPAVVNGDVAVMGDNSSFDNYVKIHQRVQQINGSLYVQGSGPLPLLSLFRVRGIKSFSCGIWMYEDGEVVDEDTPLSIKITRLFNDALKERDILQLQDALIDAGLKAWAK